MNLSKEFLVDQSHSWRYVIALSRANESALKEEDIDAALIRDRYHGKEVKTVLVWHYTHRVEVSFGLIDIPGRIFFFSTLTYLFLSGRLCSWKKPIA